MSSPKNGFQVRRTLAEGSGNSRICPKLAIEFDL